MLFVISAGGITNHIRIIQHYTDVTDATDTGFGAGGGYARFDAQVAENALF